MNLNRAPQTAGLEIFPSVKPSTGLAGVAFREHDPLGFGIESGE
jgi:hypothetical protein